MTSTPEPVAEAPTVEPTADTEQTTEPAPSEPTTPTPQELELAMAALDEIAPAGTVGQVQDARAEGGDHGQAQVVAIRHASTLPGYPDWSWTVLLSRGLEGGPTVLEVALLPGESSLLAPPWVPWTDRLADYLAAKDADETDDEDDAEIDPELESDLESDLEDDFDDDFVEDGFDEDDDEPASWAADDTTDDSRD